MRRSWAVAALPLGALACSSLFGDATQCKSDRDCARFGDGLACDVAQAVCVQRAQATGDATVDAGADDAATDAPLPDACLAAQKPSETVPTSPFDAGADAGAAVVVAKDVSLDCTKDWLVPSRLFVAAGATLTIQPHTTLRLGKGAAIVVQRGGRIVADGRTDAPIVVTSSASTPAPGDHEGVFVLGAASRTGTAPFEDDPALAYGGASNDDDSGVLRYVRVEYGRYGLVLAGVGSRTKVDFVEARKLTNNCYFLSGGTVDVKHLVCQFPGDEILEFGAGYAGRVQFVFGQKTPLTSAGRNGVLSDDSTPVIYNATICGDVAPNEGYGLLLRNDTKLDMANAILAGWNGGVDVVGTIGAPAELRSSIAFGNAGNPAFIETDTVDPTSRLFDDDKGFDEVAWFSDPARGNRLGDPGIIACFDPVAPKPWATTAVTTGARKPPEDGFFDATAAFVGAFRDANDPWMRGAWVRFANE